MIKTFGEILPKLFSELRENRFLLIDKELQLVGKLLLEICHLLGLEDLGLVEVEVMDQLLELLVPVKPEWL